MVLLPGRRDDDWLLGLESLCFYRPVPVVKAGINLGLVSISSGSSLVIGHFAGSQASIQAWVKLGSQNQAWFMYMCLL